MSQSIIYPIFRECSQYTLDSYWKDIFEGCAVNKFPKGMRYNSEKGEVFVKTDAKKPWEIISLPIKNSTTLDIYHAMMTIFKDNLQLRSTREISFDEDTLEEIKKKWKTKMDGGWKDRPKQSRDDEKLRYVSHLREKYTLTPKETRQLTATINVGIQFKQILSTDIVIDPETGYILDITSLVFDKETRRFSTTGEMSVSSKNDKSNPKCAFYAHLDKWFKSQQSRKFVIK